MRYIMPWLTFDQVQVVRQVEAVLPWMEAIAAVGGEFWTADMKRPVPRGEWADVVRAWMEEDWRPLMEWRVVLSLRFEDLPGVFLDFGVDQFTRGGNQLVIGTLLDFEFRDERPLVEPVAQRLRELGRLLYPLARPWRGMVDDSEANPLLSKDILKRRLVHLGWVNVFGPPYVERYGEELLRGWPGYQVERLADGGVWHQLSPTFVAAEEEEARRLREEVVAYGRRYGHRVTCRAPYVIPGLTRRAGVKEGGMAEEELMAYLEAILSVTLVLEDGRRLKHLPIPWERLEEGQRARVVARLREKLVEEVKRGVGKGWRLEFNAIPVELEQMLVEVFGWGNPAVEWVEVGEGEGEEGWG